MLFLPPFESEDYRFLITDAPRITFLINDSLYCMNEVWENGTRVMKMKAIDTKTLKVESINVNQEFLFQDVFETAVVHNNRAYLWHYEAQFFYEGTTDGENFRWKLIMTENSEEFNGKCLTFSYNDGDDSYFCVIDYDYYAENDTEEYFIHRVNLNEQPMWWTKRAISLKDQKLAKYVDDNEIESTDYLRVFVAGQFTHLFSHKYDDQVHLFLDLSSLELSMDVAYQNQKLPHPYKSELFTNNHQIFMISETKDKKKSVLHRYDHEIQQWTKLGTLSHDKYLVRHIPQNVGKQVHFLGAATQGPNKTFVPALCVLELEPSLFQLTAYAIAKNQRLTRLTRTLLPELIRDRLIKIGALSEGNDDQGRTEKDKEEEREDNGGEDNEEEVEKDESEWESDEDMRDMDDMEDAKLDYEMKRMRFFHYKFQRAKKDERELIGALNWMTCAYEIDEEEDPPKFIPYPSPVIEVDIDERIRTTWIRHRFQKAIVYYWNCIENSPISKHFILSAESFRTFYVMHEVCRVSRRALSSRCTSAGNSYSS
ncbi:hypothetical protein PMAYCL1PPCAC_01296 [Pristionchus mayeri]|uniref:Uncharacterized protein n=1 Tax=Pristionchus mayeri TaxID=1317129 RepID=A0AAN5C797_9BILA|nr:hypothetical protein PMAYCL1PPCAC_01296 [Pristionchus mayeri]